jgi:hypothetical protein
VISEFDIVFDVDGITSIGFDTHFGYGSYLLKGNYLSFSKKYFSIKNNT